MAEFKIVINDVKTGKSYQKVVDGANADRLIGLKIKDKVDGNLIGLKDYELEISGGSDFCGFPMKGTLSGSRMKRLILDKGPGFKIKKRAKQHVQDHYHIKKRKTVRGDTVYQKTSQINLKIVKYGKTDLKNIFKEKTGEKPVEVKEKPEKKEVKKTEEKPKEEAKKSKEHGKEETKPEEKK